MNTLQQALRTKDFALTAEIRLSASTSTEKILAQVDGFSDIVDAIQVTDNPGGIPHISPIAASSILLQHGFDPVLHLTCRDRNRIALRSDLLGAAALGVTSLLIRRGDSNSRSSDGNPKSVFDWDAVTLIKEARSMGDESVIENPVDFLIGTAAVAFKPGKEWVPVQMADKIRAGANFVQTQLCFDADLLRHYVARIVEQRLTEKIDVIVNLTALSSIDSAKWLGKNLRGAAVPAKIVRRLRQASDAESEGVRICAELLHECRDIPGVAGANLVSGGNMPLLKAAIETAGTRS